MGSIFGKSIDDCKTDIKELDEAIDYLLQKPSMERQQCNQSYESFAPYGIPKCYDPILYWQSIAIINQYSKQTE